MEYIALKDIAKITMGQSPDSSSYNENGEGLPFYQGNADFGELYPNERVWCNAPKKVAKPNDILISVRAPIGALNYAKDKCCIGRGLAAITVEDDAERNYIFHLLKAKNADLNKQGTGSTFKAIGRNILEELKVPQISQDEKQRCMHLMDLLESIIRGRKLQLTTLDQLVKARFIEMFGDTEKNTNCFEEMKLGDICDLQNGYAFKSEDYVDFSTVNNCRMSNIRPNGGFDSEYSPKYLPDAFWDKYENYRLCDGDVIIAMTDMASDPKILGVPTIVKSDGKRFLLNQRVGKLMFAEENQFNRVFLMRFLSQSYIRMNLAKKAGGSTQINVGKPAILDINILRPSIESQNQFADFVKQVDKSKVAVQAALDEAQLLFDSLMQQYFG